MSPFLNGPQLEDLLKYIDEVDIYPYKSDEGFCCTNEGIDDIKRIIGELIKKKCGLPYRLYVWEKAEYES